MKKKGLSLRTTFLIADSDDSKTLSNQEFFKVVTETLEIRLSQPEQGEYWGRITRGSAKETATYSQILTFFGGMLDAELLGKNDLKQNISDVNKIFKNNDSAVQPSLLTRDKSALLGRFSEDIKRVMKETNKKEKDVFDAYDLDKNGRIYRSEFMLTSENILRLKLKPEELAELYELFDKNEDGIDLKELFEAINFNIVKYKEDLMKSEKNLQPAELPPEEVLLNFIVQAKKYMKDKDLSVFQFYCMMDKSKDNLISRAEISAFIKNKLGIALSPRDSMVILNEIDKSGDDKISAKEFVEFLKVEATLKFLNKSESVKELKANVVLHFLYDHMVDKELSVADLMLSIDKNHSGSVDTIELGLYLKSMNSLYSQEQIERFLALVDTDMNKSISYSELEAVLEAYRRMVEAPIEIPAAKKDELLKKLIHLVDNNKEQIKLFLKQNEEKEGFIKELAFRKILAGTNKFTPNEIDMIINPICHPFTTNRRIRYAGLFDLKNIHNQVNKLKQSGIAQSRGKTLVDQIFAALKKVSRKHNITPVQLFQCFDVDNNGSITLAEMR